MATGPKDRWSTPEVRVKIDEVEQINWRLRSGARVKVYTVPYRALAEVEVGLAYYNGPLEIDPGPDDDSGIWLRIGDRIAYLDDDQAAALMRAIQLSREADGLAMR